MRYPATWSILFLLIAVAVAGGLTGFFVGFAFMFLLVFGLIGLCTFAIEFARSLRK